MNLQGKNAKNNNMYFELLLNNFIDEGFEFGLGFRKMLNEEGQYSCSRIQIGLFFVTLNLWINGEEQGA